MSIRRLLGIKKKERIPPNVNFDQGYIFIHIPKTAGTSIFTSLGMDRSHHKFLSFYKALLDEQTFSKLYKFAFVRDPLDRFLSLYNYARLKVSHFHNNEQPEKAMYGKHKDYELLKNASLLECANYLIEGRLKQGAPEIAWLPQTRWLEINGRLDEVDEIGRFESLEKDFSRIRSKLSFPLEQQNFLLAVNPSVKTSEPVSSEVVDIVRDYYREDYLNFGYKIA